MAAVDPITMQVVRYGLEQIADEMGYTMMRTARSTVIKEVLDFSCALADRQGRTIAQAHHVPMLVGSLDITMKRVLEHYGGGGGAAGRGRRGHLQRPVPGRPA